LGKDEEKEKPNTSDLAQWGGVRKEGSRGVEFGKGVFLSPTGAMKGPRGVFWDPSSHNRGGGPQLAAGVLDPATYPHSAV